MKQYGKPEFPDARMSDAEYAAWLAANAAGRPKKPPRAQPIGKLSVASRRRYRLWLQHDKLCHWCGCETVFPGSLSDGRLEPQAATIDHLHSRLSVERQQGNHKVVLACNECNHRRCREEHREIFGDPKAKPPKMLAQVLICWISVP